MAYIGNTVENQGFTPAIDYFNGNGVTVTFTLSRPIASVAQVIVAIDNVIQNPSSSFTIAGNAITFSSAPLSGTNNIWVEYTSLITTYQAISQDPTVIGDIRATGGYLAEGDFGNSFVDGAILDYVTGLGRITVGDADGLAIYNGGTTARTALMTVAATGNVGVGTDTPTFKTEIVGGATTVETTLLQVRSNAGGLNTGTTIALANSTNPTAGSGRVELAALRNTASGSSFVVRTADSGGNITECMRIDSAGRITMPFQPAFFAYGAGSQSWSGTAAYQILQLGSQNTLGSRSTGYNTGTYIFTAPIAGTYMFFVKITQTSGTTGPAARIFINGVAANPEILIAYSTTFASISGFLTIQLAASDAVTLRVINFNDVSFTLDTTRSSFSGWLLG